MIGNKYIKIFCVGLVLPFLTVFPTISLAETLQVIHDDVSSAVKVPIGGNIVVDTRYSFFETATANPDIADIETLSDREIAVTGKSQGVTTLTLLYEDDSVNNVALFVSEDVATSDAAVVTVPEIPTAKTIAVNGGKASDRIDAASSRAFVVHTDIPFDELSIADTDIINVVALTERSIYVLARNVGKTTLSLFGGGREVNTEIEVEVGPNN